MKSCKNDCATCDSDGNCLSCGNGWYLKSGSCYEPVDFTVSYDFNDQYLNLYENKELQVTIKFNKPIFIVD